MTVIAPLILTISDVRLARFLVRNPIKNTTMNIMYVRVPSGAKAIWPLVDGCFER